MLIGSMFFWIHDYYIMVNLPGDSMPSIIPTSALVLASTTVPTTETVPVIETSSIDALREILMTSTTLQLIIKTGMCHYEQVTL